MIKVYNTDPDSYLRRFEEDFKVTAIALHYTVVPVECKIETISLAANSAGSTAATVTVTRMLDGTVVGSGTFTSGTIGTVIIVDNPIDVGITQGSVLSINTSSTTTMAYTVGIVYTIDSKKAK